MYQSGITNQIFLLTCPSLFDSRNSCAPPHLAVRSGSPRYRIFTPFPASERWPYIRDRHSDIMGFGVYRSGSTLATSLALIHRYTGSVVESLPVSSSEYTLRMYQSSVTSRSRRWHPVPSPVPRCSLLVRSAASHLRVLRPLIGRVPPRFPHDSIYFQV